MKLTYCTLIGFLLLAGCDRQNPQSAQSLTEARRGFQTHLTGQNSPKEAVPEPPANVMRVVRYDSPAGSLAAYLSPDPKDGKKHPAIIWITGGDCNSIGDVWEEMPRSNDQTASAFRKAGIVMLYPSLRGGNDNPGLREGFLGEVDDVLAAADYLAKQEFVDPQRIYLGGHSTGGTLVLLVAECSDRFRAVFSFGPVDNVAGYGPEYLPFDSSSKREVQLRSPIGWLNSIKSPVFIFEGTRSPGNLRSLKAIARVSKNSMIHFLPVDGANHFSILAPTTESIAQSVLADEGSVTQLAFDQKELSSPFAR